MQETVDSARDDAAASIEARQSTSAVAAADGNMTLLKCARRNCGFGRVKVSGAAVVADFDVAVLLRAVARELRRLQSE